MCFLAAYRGSGGMNPAIRYAVADADYQVIEEMIRARSEAELTQETLAVGMDTTQSEIARLQGGRVSPPVETQRRYAAGVGKRLRVEFV